MLEVCGHSFTVAQNGEDAIRHLEAGSFDAVLMDVRMPGVDGLEATRRIRAMHSAISGIRIIGVTAGASAPEVLECQQAGMDSCIGKPLTLRAVEDALSQVRKRIPDAGDSATLPPAAAGK
jgi:CheY-like chemotaxis protein